MAGYICRADIFTYIIYLCIQVGGDICCDAIIYLYRLPVYTRGWVHMLRCYYLPVLFTCVYRLVGDIC